VIGSSGNDVLDLTGVETVTAGIGNDDITVTDNLGADISLGNGDDTLTLEKGGAFGNGTLTGGSGTDVVNVYVDENLTGSSDLDLNNNFTGIERVNLVDQSETDNGHDIQIVLASTFNNGNAIIFDASTSFDATSNPNGNLNGLDVGESLIFDASAYGQSSLSGSFADDELTVVGGAGNDTISTAELDEQRGLMTVDLSSGGVDTVVISNASQNGSKSIGSHGSVATFTSNFQVVASADTLGVTIQGFTAGNDGDRLHIEFGSVLTDVYGGVSLSETVTPVTAGYDPATGSSGQIEKGVDLTTTNLSSVSSGDVIEISSAIYQLGGLGTWDITSVAGRLSNQGDGNALVGLQDGYYTVAIYSDNSDNADAFLFNIRVDAGDGLDFGWGTTGLGDFDMIEYVGVIQDVGADTLQAVNFI